MPTTDWKSRVTSLDLTDTRGDPVVVDWVPGMDSRVSLDLSDRTGGAALTGVSAKLWRLKPFGDAADVNQDAKMVGSPEVDGATVRVRLANLDPGYYYRLSILYGPSGSKEGAGLLIHSWE